MEKDNNEKQKYIENMIDTKALAQTAKMVRTVATSFKGSYTPAVKQMKTAMFGASKSIIDYEKLMKPFKTIDVSSIAKAVQKSFKPISHNNLYGLKLQNMSKPYINIPRPAINNELLENINKLMLNQIHPLVSEMQKAFEPIVEMHKEREYCVFLGKTGWPFFDSSVNAEIIDSLKGANYTVDSFYSTNRDLFEMIENSKDEFEVNEPFDADIDQKIYEKIKRNHDSIEMLKSLCDNEICSRHRENIEEIIQYLNNKDYKTCEYYLFSLLDTLILDELSPMISQGQSQINGQANRILRKINSRFNDDSNYDEFAYKTVLHHVQNILCFDRLFQYVGDYKAYCNQHYVVNRNVLMHYGTKMRVTKKDVFKTVILIYAMVSFDIPLMKLLVENNRKEVKRKNKADPS